MDLALAIEALVPGAAYRGSTTANTKAAFTATVWEDARPKPTWSEIQTVAASVDIAMTKRLFQQAVEAHVEATVAERGYSSSASCAGYAASTIPAWAKEAQAFIAWRDAVWAHVFSQMALVEAGDREEPTVEAFVAELPPIIWPA